MFSSVWASGSIHCCHCRGNTSCALVCAYLLLAASAAAMSLPETHTVWACSPLTLLAKCMPPGPASKSSSACGSLPAAAEAPGPGPAAAEPGKCEKHGKVWEQQDERGSSRVRYAWRKEGMHGAVTGTGDPGVADTCMTCCCAEHWNVIFCVDDSH